MSVKRVGSTEQYALGWERAFGKKSARPASRSKPAAKKKMANQLRKK